LLYSWNFYSSVLLRWTVQASIVRFVKTVLRLKPSIKERCIFSPHWDVTNPRSLLFVIFKWSKVGSSHVQMPSKCECSSVHLKPSVKEHYIFFSINILHYVSMHVARTVHHASDISHGHDHTVLDIRLNCIRHFYISCYHYVGH